MTQGPTSDIRVRQAMSYAINRQEICDTFYKGLANRAASGFSVTNVGVYPTSFKADSYDPNKAKQLLQESRYPGQVQPAEHHAVHHCMAADLMQILQGYWQAVGINVDVSAVDTPVYKRPGLLLRAKEAPEKQVGAVWPW